MEGNIVFVLSGEHPEMALAELRSLLEILNVNASVEQLSERLALVRMDLERASGLCRRAAYVKEASAALLSTTIDYLFSKLDLDPDLTLESPIAVKAKKMGNVSASSLDIERWVGGELKRTMPDLQVDLERPVSLIRVYVHNGLLVIGRFLSSSPSKELESRRPGKRAFRHPAAIHPKLARLMVNLTRTRLGGYVLDPFAGTCSIPLEASLLGYRAIGIEVRRWIAHGCHMNFEEYAKGSSNVIAGDARFPPLRRVIDGIATDPPYGRSTYTAGVEIEDLLDAFFSKVEGVLKEGARIVIAYPIGEFDLDVFADHGLEVLEEYSYRVHASLTRGIAVVRFR